MLHSNSSTCDRSGNSEHSKFLHFELSRQISLSCSVLVLARLGLIQIASQIILSSSLYNLRLQHTQGCTGKSLWNINTLSDVRLGTFRNLLQECLE